MKAIKNTRRAVSIIVAALVVALVATGCTRTPGAAATVNGERVAIEEVQSSFEVFSALNGLIPSNYGQPNAPIGGLSQQDMLFLLIIGPTAMKNATESGLTIASRDQISISLSEKLTEAGYNPQILASHESAIDVARYEYSYVALINLANEGNPGPLMKTLEDIEKLDVTVNPRYGKYDWSTMQQNGLPTVYQLDRPWLIEAPNPKS